VGQACRLRPPRWARWAAFLLVALLGLLLRLPQLGARPMHTDEAVNAYIVGELLAGKTFTYDPQDAMVPCWRVCPAPGKIAGRKKHFPTSPNQNCA